KDLPYKVIYNGFNLKAIKEQKKRNKPLTFGFIGQVKESKGIELLIKVFLKLRNYKWKLLIGGNLDSTYLKHLKSLNNSPDIEYLGYVKSDSFFEKIDILVVPSLWNEPFGRVVLESFVNRKPVLASNMGGLSELLSVNKDFLFDPNLESLTTQIENILSNPNVLDDFNFDQDFINLFSINETVHKYIKVFESVLNKTQ
ncbi:MAG: glycosyltransferase, partial [Flavobacteriaceae bacterium]